MSWILESTLTKPAPCTLMFDSRAGRKIMETILKHEKQTDGGAGQISDVCPARFQKTAQAPRKKALKDELIRRSHGDRRLTTSDDDGYSGARLNSQAAADETRNQAASKVRANRGRCDTVQNIQSNPRRLSCGKQRGRKVNGISLSDLACWILLNAGNGIDRADIVARYFDIERLYRGFYVDPCFRPKERRRHDRLH